jgi:RimJ/RimL family protein N-acetyltransferase
MDKDTLITDRLILRTIRARDAEALTALADNYKVAVMLARLPYPYKLADAYHFIAWVNEKRDGEGTFGLYIKPEETFIGMCSYEWHGEEAPEFGYWLGEPYWGEGYMSEAAQAAIAHAFTVHRHQKLLSGCRLQNIASRRVLEKAGFEHVGRYEVDSLVLKAKLPGHRFCLTRERWEGLAA